MTRRMRRLIATYRIDRRAALLRFHTSRVTLPPRLTSRSRTIPAGSTPAGNLRSAA